MQEITLPYYDIAIIRDGKRGAIVSGLHEEDESSELQAAIDALEALILGHVLCDVDVYCDEYAAGVRTAVEAIRRMHSGDAEEEIESEPAPKLRRKKKSTTRKTKKVRKKKR